jgi:hypothetical protein
MRPVASTANQPSSAHVDAAPESADPIAPRLSGEAGERVRDQQQERIDVQRVADVARDEVVQRLWRATADQRRKPVDEHSDENGDPPQRQPDEVRHRQQEAKEDGQSRSDEVVADADPQRTPGSDGWQRHRVRIAVGVAVGQ